MILFIYLDRIPFSRVDLTRISGLVLMISDVRKKQLTDYPITSVCEQVFTLFTNLQYLNVCSFGHINFPRLSFENKLPTFSSPTLMELHINLMYLDDCFHLLDGRFNQLRVLCVNIVCIYPPSVLTKNSVSYFCMNKTVAQMNI
jgi:hypothetical protein